MTVSVEYLADIRSRLRVGQTQTDTEIADLIEAARAELITAGVRPSAVSNESDALIKSAITTLIKADYGLDPANGEKYRKIFESYKVILSLDPEYRG